MIRAYNEIYLNAVMRNLAAMFDIAINAMELDPVDFASDFSRSAIASGIEKGNPKYLCGKSATELLEELLGRDVAYTQIPLDRSPEYWAGWVLAYTQWYLDKPFASILNVIPFDKLISLYNPYHEAVETKTAEYIKSLYPNGSALKRIRLLRNLSQKQLADLSGVKLRSIQCYEQGDINIHNAQAETLRALAKVLDCTIGDLLQ